jgi:pimeloyl-ACP methyl ester carboxylesterase
VRPRRDEAVTLADGRRLGFAEWGPKGGRPLIWHPGTPGSRLSFPIAEPALRRGLRVVSTERPGFGRSDLHPGRSIAGWARDLAALADHLGLDRFALAGFSGAGPYLLAAAHALGDRLTGAALISCLGPLDAAGAKRGMAWSRRASLALLRFWPRLAAKLLSTWLGDRDPERLYRAMTRDLAPVDRQVLARPGVFSALLAGVEEALRPGLDGFVQELALGTSPWGLPLEAIATPVTLWHGTADASTPLSMALHLARVLPRAALRVLPDQGHFLLLDYADEILDALGLG